MNELGKANRPVEKEHLDIPATDGSRPARFGPTPRPLAERFWEKVDRRGPDECWPWQACTDNGYGVIRAGGRYGGNRQAHRVAWALLAGPIPAGLTLDHFRLNPGPRQAPCSRACVNPAHLEPATRGENTLRGNGPPAANARKTHCPGGHAYDAFALNRRRCRQCHRGEEGRRRADAKRRRARKGGLSGDRKAL